MPVSSLAIFAPSQPQPGVGFNYTEAEFVKALDGLLIALGVTGEVQIVTSGFLPASYGLTWALQNAARVKRVVALNGPLTAGAALPGSLAALRVPFMGEFAAQVSADGRLGVGGGHAVRKWPGGARRKKSLLLGPHALHSVEGGDAGTACVCGGGSGCGAGASTLVGVQ